MLKVSLERLYVLELCIRTLIYANDGHHLSVSSNQLGRVLMAQKWNCDETMELFKRSLAIDIKQEAPDALNTALNHKNLGFLYLQLAIMDQPTVELIKKSTTC